MRRPTGALFLLVAATGACSTIFGFERLDEAPLAGPADSGDRRDGDSGGSSTDGAVAGQDSGPIVGADGSSGAALCPPEIFPPVDCPEGKLYRGRCYFVIPPFLTAQQAATECVKRRAELATFTCADELFNAGGLGNTNYWLGAFFDGTQWRWNSGEPFVFYAGGDDFDASPPVDPKTTCLERGQRGAWYPVPCSSNSTGAYCERTH